MKTSEWLVPPPLAVWTHLISLNQLFFVLPSVQVTYIIPGQARQIALEDVPLLAATPHDIYTISHGGFNDMAR